MSIKELPIPTYYGDEISYVNGIKYAYQICVATIKSQLQKTGLFYDRKFDCGIKNEKIYMNKEKFYSTHSEILKYLFKAKLTSKFISDFFPKPFS